MSTRYPDDPGYRGRGASDPRATAPGRREARGEREDRDREVLRTSRRVTDEPVDTRMSDPMDTRMLDPRMDSRGDLRPSAVPRLDPRPDRGIDSRSRESEPGVVYYTTRGSELVPPREVSVRPPYPRDDDPMPRSRTTLDSVPRDRGDRDIRPKYTEYFCPGDGIEREVIQHEICKYLGQDATCRPGQDSSVRCNGRDLWRDGPLTACYRVEEDTGSMRIDHSQRYAGLCPSSSSLGWS